MEGKKKRKTEQKYYRLYGCRFTEEEYVFIENKLKNLQGTRLNGEKRNNSEILIKLFKLALEDENKVRGQKYD